MWELVTSVNGKVIRTTGVHQTRVATLHRARVLATQEEQWTLERDRLRTRIARARQHAARVPSLRERMQAEGLASGHLTDVQRITAKLEWCLNRLTLLHVAFGLDLPNVQVPVSRLEGFTHYRVIHLHGDITQPLRTDRTNSTLWHWREATILRRAIVRHREHLRFLGVMQGISIQHDIKTRRARELDRLRKQRLRARRADEAIVTTPRDDDLLRKVALAQIKESPRYMTGGPGTRQATSRKRTRP